MSTKPHDPLTAGPASREAGISADYLRRLVDRGTVRAARGPLGARLIDRASLREFIRERDMRRQRVGR